MKQLYFNELTLDDAPQQNLLLLCDFRRLVKSLFAATAQIDIDKHIVIDEDASGKLYDAIYAGNPEERSTLVSWFQRVYVGPGVEDGNLLKQFGEDLDYRLMLPLDDGVRVYDEKLRKPCMSFGLAYRNNSVTLGFCSSRFWKRHIPEYKVKEMSVSDDGSLMEQEINAICITDREQVKTRVIKDWIDREVHKLIMRNCEDDSDLVPCQLAYELRKQPSFKVPHKDNEKLKAFSDKIVRHKYVEGVVDTLPFDSTTSRFVLKSYKDGTIDIRLHWTETGCGLKVQTVGKNLKQTMRIAELLKEKYDKRS